MKKIKWLRLLAGWFSTIRCTALISFSLLGIFVGIHLLGKGDLHEIRYSLWLCGVGLALAAGASLLRYADRYVALQLALQNPPAESSALPEGATQPERAFRALADQYRRERDAAALQAAQNERDRLDYFTLWVHQIKTPISALDLMAQSDDPVDRSLLRQEVFKIGQYADAALTFQRLQSLHNDLALNDVPLYPLCCAVVKTLRPIFLYRKIGLKMEPFEGSALSDAKWLGMAITQVLTNALKYTPKGGTITVVLRQPGVLTIRDTGVGISAEDLPRVFDRGFTGHIGHSGMEGEKSTGIGLYLCKQACDKLGHTITLSCPPEGGTVATFDLRREVFEVFS